MTKDQVLELKLVGVIFVVALSIIGLASCYTPKPKSLWDMPTDSIMLLKFEEVTERMPLEVPLPIKTDFKTLDEIYNYVYKTYDYKTDLDTYGKSDYWATPAEFIYNNGGDCEDFAIMAYYLILHSGIAKEEDIQMILLYDYNKDGKGHVVLVVDGQVLDNQQTQIQTMYCPCFNNYKAITIVNGTKGK